MRSFSIRGIFLSAFILSIAGLGRGTAAAPTAAQQLGLTVPNLVAYYPLDETTGTAALDQAGPYNGTYMGTTLPAVDTVNVSPVPAPTNPNNPASRAFTATTTNQRVNVPDNGAFDFTGPFTLSCWARVSALSANQMGLIEHWSGSNPTISGYFIRFGRNSTTGEPYPMFSIGNGNATQLYAESSATAVPVGSWVHMAGVYDGANIILYYNNTALATTVAATAPTAGAADLHLGVDYGANRLEGNLDEVRIYNTDLVPDQIGVLYNGQAAPGVPTLTPGPQSITVSWTAPAAQPAGAPVTYTVQRATAVAGPWTTVASGLTALTYTNTGIFSTTTLYYYRVIAVSVMESAPATNTTGAMALPGVPKPPSDNGEGLWDDKCACGTSIPAAPGAVFGMAAFAALLCLVRRR